VEKVKSIARALFRMVVMISWSVWSIAAVLVISFADSLAGTFTGDIHRRGATGLFGLVLDAFHALVRRYDLMGATDASFMLFGLTLLAVPIFFVGFWRLIARLDRHAASFVTFLVAYMLTVAFIADFVQTIGNLSASAGH